MKSAYVLWGKVKAGKKRGKPLGFPTANIALHKDIPEGIYTATVRIGKKTYKAATFIGAAKIFGEKDYKAESYIFDFNDDIYDMWITIKLFKKIRGNETFTSEQALVKQMKEDVLAVRKFFGDVVNRE